MASKPGEASSAVVSARLRNLRAGRPIRAGALAQGRNPLTGAPVVSARQRAGRARALSARRAAGAVGAVG